MNSLSTQSALGTPPTANRRIFQAAVVVAFFSGLALLGSTGKELVLAQWFGRGDALDAFLIAFLLPSFIVNLVAGSFNSAVIPTFIQVRETEGAAAAQRLFNGVTIWCLVLLVGVSVLLGVLAPFYLPLLGSGFSAAKLILTRRLLYILVPFVVFNGLSLTWTGVLNAGERFALPAILPILTPLSAVAFLFLAGKAWGILALAVGTTIGAAMQAALLAWTLKAHGTRLELRWYGMDPHLRQAAGQYVPMLAGALLMGSTELVDQSMAAMLDPGSVAALNYARKVVTFFLVMGALPLSKAALPYFSQMVSKRDWAGCRHTLLTYSRVIVLVTVPITLGLVVFSQPLIRLLFERGAFTAGDTRIVTRVQAFLSLQIPFYILCNLGVPLISALKRNSVLMTIAGVNMVLNVVLNLILMRYAGIAGIALSTSLVYLVSCILVFWWLLVALRRANPRESSDGNSGL